MFEIYQITIKIIFYFCLGISAIGLADLAMSLHDVTAAAYQRGPVSAVTFTRTMIGRDDCRDLPTQVEHKKASKR